MGLPTLSVKRVAREKLGPRMREIRKAHEVSVSRLVGELYDARAPTNYDASFVGRVERGEKEPPDRLLAGYLDIVQPSLDELPEAHLAKARVLLNPAEVGLDEALANLDAISPSETPDQVVERVGAALEQRLDRELRRSRPSRGRSATSKRASGNQ